MLCSKVADIPTYTFSDDTYLVGYDTPLAYSVSFKADIFLLRLMRLQYQVLSVFDYLSTDS